MITEDEFMEMMKQEKVNSPYDLLFLIFRYLKFLSIAGKFEALFELYHAWYSHNDKQLVVNLQ